MRAAPPAILAASSASVSDVNGGAVGLLVLAGVAALVDWWSVATGRHEVERIAKPLTMALLIVVAVFLEPQSAAVRSWFVVGLLLSLIGDVLLMLQREMFVPGLGAFLAAHVAFTVGLALAGIAVIAALVGLAVALIAIFVIGRRIQQSAAESEAKLAAPVASYIAAISAMLVAAAGTTNLVAIGGAALFYASDAILGWNRFVSPIRNGRVLTMMTYHSAQALLVAALLTL